MDGHRILYGKYVLAPTTGIIKDPWPETLPVAQTSHGESSSREDYVVVMGCVLRGC